MSCKLVTWGMELRHSKHVNTPASKFPVRHTKANLDNHN